MYNQKKTLYTEDGDILNEKHRNLTLKGTTANKGIAFGKISFLKRVASEFDKVKIRSINAECERFEKARQHAITQLSALYEASLEKLGEQNAVLFQIHQMMLDDPDYVSSINEVIRKEKANAEYAVHKVALRFEKQFLEMDNDYMRGRASDVIDISRRINEILMMHAGKIKSKGISFESDGPVILATDDLAPSETVQLDQHTVTGIITTKGSDRSHTAIFARTMGIPTVVCIGSKLTKRYEGKFAIIDANTGTVYIDPDEETILKFNEIKKTDDAQHSHLEEFRGVPTKTRSGRKIRLYANSGSLSDIDLVKASDAEGIGLFRSEYIYLQSKDYPTEDEQFEIYKEVLKGMGDKKVIIRTLDIGADKTAEYFMLKPEDNPAMGLRAIRLCLSNRALFKTQLRALYRASVYGNLSIMVPMITSVEEVTETKKIIEAVKKELKEQHLEFKDEVEFGIMIETPAAALISDELAPYVDFFSIGTNDLTQFTLAADRQNADLVKYLNPYHHSVVRLIEMTIQNGHAAGIWVGICGELASDEHFLGKLIQLGIDEMSVVPSSVLTLRAKIASLG
ncbi:phosphoenolpyruvate--protein phosphotransferase [Succinivibrio dextrinosolvens]|uniref:phosphoenolpyruvate--protein phosphotransferase n=1 Tax=Succinivibrio dextrinosolvens TaxID=83771 RepID=UPI00241D82D0|nr:phosphoenolpyruvate--protein phosphotransferase [Succinivibrio dextrinosolvens]MBE6422166.1 phosphoenolpyruvate--protein phosphotransferase [Succinivibrio dextrinosolvens]